MTKREKWKICDALVLFRIGEFDLVLEVLESMVSDDDVRNYDEVAQNE